MSLESLNSLRQLVQVEQQGESAQKENLDQVQQSVQSQGTSEAQRVDSLHLEKAKAQYDHDIQAAHIKTIEAKHAREQMALAVSGIVAIGVSAISLGDAALSFAKDMGAGNLSLTGNKDKSGLKLGDRNQGDKVRDIDPNTGRHVAVGKQGTAATDHYFIGDNPDGSQTVQRAKKNSNGSFNDDIRSATISENDVNDFLTQKKGEKNNMALIDSDGNATNKAKIMGLSDKDGKFTEEAEKLGLGVKGSAFNIDNIKNFDDVMKLDDLSPNNKMSESLFDKKSHSILKSEVDGFLNFADAKANDLTKLKVFNDKTSTAGAAMHLTGLSPVARMIDGDGTKMTNPLEDALKSSGKMSNITAGDVMKSGLNELIRAGETAMPFLQAYLKMKEQVTQTAIELEAAKEKLAAALRKIKELEQLIVTSGGAKTTENVAAPTGL